MDLEPYDVELADVIEQQYRQYLESIDIDPGLMPMVNYASFLIIFKDGWVRGASDAFANRSFPADVRATMLATIRARNDGEDPSDHLPEPLQLALEPLFGAGWREGEAAVKQGLVEDARH